MKKIFALILVMSLLATTGCMGARFSSAVVRVGTGSDLVEKTKQIDVNKDTHEDVIEILGQPLSYIWGDAVFTEDNLPDYYIMTYPDGFDVEIVQGKIQELRYYNDNFTHSTGVKVGMSLEDVISAVGEPVKEVVAKGCYFTPGILYKDINEDEGYCYYDVKDINIRMFFTDYKVNSVYVTNEIDLFDELQKDFQKKIESGEIEKRVDDIDMPFVNDDHVIGTWRGVDFVTEKEQFSTKSIYWSGGIYLEKLVFKPGGAFEFHMDAPWEGTWTKGYVLNTVMTTASAYETFEVDGEEYMFFEWKSGDYSFRGKKPSYYVLKKVE